MKYQKRITMGRQNRNIKPGTKRPESSRVKRFGDNGWSIPIPTLLPSKKYLKDNQYIDKIGGINTASGKMFPFVNTKGAFIEIPEEEAGYKFERVLPKFWSSLGIPKRDILFPSMIIGKTNQPEEFSDGVILFGDTAFLIQAKVRTPKYEDTYQLPDTKKRIISKITEAKNQYYRSLRLAKDYSSNIVEMSSLSGEKRVIDIDKYNWVSLNIITRNYFGDTNAKLIAPSKMTSTLDYGFSHVNHVIMTLQGIYNLSTVFSNHYELLSFFKMLSYYPHDYELCKEVELVNEVYGKVYGLEDNSLALIGILNKHVNDLFNSDKLNKEEARQILMPLYSSDRVALEELFVNAENNFHSEDSDKLFIWTDGITKYSLRFDRSGRFYSLTDTVVHLKNINSIQDKDLAFSHFDKILSIDDTSSIEDILKFSITASTDKIDEEELLDQIKDNLNSYKDISSSKILEIIETNGYSKEYIILFAHTIFVIQVAPILYSGNYNGSIFSEIDDKEKNSKMFDTLEQNFLKLTENIKVNPIIEAWHGEDKIKIESNRYNFVPLVIISRGRWQDEKNNYELPDHISRPGSSNIKKLFFTIEEIEYAVQKISFSGILFDFLRRTYIREENSKIEDFFVKVDNYMKFYEFKTNEKETLYFINLFNHSVMHSFNKGSIGNETTNTIFSIFDNESDQSFRKKLVLVNKKIEKSKALSSKYTFHFELDNIKVYFTLCYGITENDNTLKKIVADLLSRIPDPAPKLTFGILTDVLDDNKSKHGLFGPRDSNESFKVPY